MADSMTNMLLAIFEAQTEDPNTEILPVEEWEKKMEGEGKLSKFDAALLIGSPGNRVNYDIAVSNLEKASKNT